MPVKNIELAVRHGFLKEKVNGRISDPKDITDMNNQEIKIKPSNPQYIQ